jgi:hypothetical protein
LPATCSLQKATFAPSHWHKSLRWTLNNTGKPIYYILHWTLNNTGKPIYYILVNHINSNTTTLRDLPTDTQIITPTIHTVSGARRSPGAQGRRRILNVTLKRSMEWRPRWEPLKVQIGY